MEIEKFESKQKSNLIEFQINYLHDNFQPECRNGLRFVNLLQILAFKSNLLTVNIFDKVYFKLYLYNFSYLLIMLL